MSLVYWVPPFQSEVAWATAGGAEHEDAHSAWHAYFREVVQESPSRCKVPGRYKM
jgi:hypothetical protein